jgi:topoisomerase-4 subunit A
LDYATTHPEPKVILQFDKRSNDREDEEIDLVEFISVKGVTAMGNRLTPYKVKALERIEPEIEEEEIEDEEMDQVEEEKVEPIADEPAQEVEFDIKPTKKNDKKDDSDDSDDKGGPNLSGNGQATLF